MTAVVANTRTDRSRLLRTALRVDAVATGANGVAYALGAGAIGRPLGIGATELVVIGVLFVGWCAALLWLARAPRPRRGAVWAVIAVNAAWAVDSLAVVAAGWGHLTTVGNAWVVAQALLVAGFAVAQYAGLRRAA